MVVVWFILLEKSIESRINKTLVKKLMLIYLFVALALPMIYFLPPTEQTHLFTLSMGYGIGVPSFFLALIVLKAVWDRNEGRLSFKRLPWGNPAFSSLLLSLALFGVGGAIGVPGLESNLRVPAHYHGALGAVTMAFMGMTYLLLRGFGITVYSERVARYQPYLYGLGLLVIIIGLYWAGSYDAPRKAFGYEDPLTALAMNIMGAGALVAVLGGAAFVANTMLSLLRGCSKVLNK
jgi:heme/copper-type cytochrome/quinol oxidase subunit 1